MKITTLCYIEHDGQYLMLHRIKKENDINEGKWIGVGGHAKNACSAKSKRKQGSHSHHTVSALS